METSVELSCGGVIERFFGVDPEFRSRVMTKSVFSVPSGKSVTTGFERAYPDDDSDGEFDRIVSSVAVDLNLDGVIDANDPASTAELDLVNAKLTLTSPLGRSAESFYDSATLLTTRSHVPGFFDTVYEYYPDTGNDFGKIKSVKMVDQGNSDAVKGASVYTYYQAPDVRAGRLHTAGADTDFDGIADEFVEYDYDNLGRVTRVTGPDGNSVWFWYDANGNMSVLTTPHAVDHEFAVNEVDSPESYLTPLSGAYTYTYDLDRRPKKVIFPSAQDAPTGAPAWDNRIIENFYHGNEMTHAGCALRDGGELRVVSRTE